MGIIYGAEQIILPELIDKKVRNKLLLFTMIKPTKRIIELFINSIFMISEQFKIDRFDVILKCNCVITDRTNKVTFGINKENTVDEENEYGIHTRFCIYPVHKWIENMFNDNIIKMIILEELCHFYWSIENEKEVCYKVFEIMHRYDKELKITDIYSNKFLENNE